MAVGIPDELEGVLERARHLSFTEARQLSSTYDRGPGTPGDHARKAADAAAKELGLGEARAAWLQEAGRAIMTAQTQDPWDATHDEPWRWATQTVLDVARATLVRHHILDDQYQLLVRPWNIVIRDGGGGIEELNQPKADGVPRRTALVPFLEERIGSDEQIMEAAILERATYIVAYVVVEAADGTYRVTHRGTGQYDYFFDTLIAHDRWEADREVDLLKKRFKLAGPRVSGDVRYYRETASAIAALRRLES